MAARPPRSSSLPAIGRGMRCRGTTKLVSAIDIPGSTNSAAVPIGQVSQPPRLAYTARVKAEFSTLFQYQ